MAWKDWAGYHAVRSYDTCHEREYFAIRHAAAMFDVTPLFKYDVRGPDAARFLSRVMVKDVGKLKPGRVSYLCWCDDDGKVVDDGTVSRLDEEQFRVTAAEPSLAWFHRFSAPYRVTIEDVTERLGALAIQGPTSRLLLAELAGDAAARLRFFRTTAATVGGREVRISRTGYTGDLGYELWVGAEDALDVWDRLMAAGAAYRLVPAGLDALDVSRVEAGFIMNGVDYYSAHHCLIESRKSSPYELGLDWTVQLDREPFVGQAALCAEQARGPRRKLAGLVLDWDEYERLFAREGLPPHVSSAAWREPVPVFDTGGRQVGYATSGAWSPMRKQNLALASVEAAHGAVGTRLQMEVTVEYVRRKVTAMVTEMPFFDPRRKRST